MNTYWKTTYQPHCFESRLLLDVRSNVRFCLFEWFLKREQRAVIKIVGKLPMTESERRHCCCNCSRRYRGLKNNFTITFSQNRFFKFVLFSLQALIYQKILSTFCQFRSSISLALTQIWTILRALLAKENGRRSVGWPKLDGLITLRILDGIAWDFTQAKWRT